MSAIGRVWNSRGGALNGSSPRKRGPILRGAFDEGRGVPPGPDEGPRCVWVPAFAGTTNGNISPSRFEKTVRRVPGGTLFGHGNLQPLDFRGHQRDTLGKFLDRQQREVLPDLVGDFLSGLVVVLDGHAFYSGLIQRAVKRLPAGTPLANQMPL